MTNLQTVVVAIALAMSIIDGHGQVLDYSVAPQDKDNFLGADFRYINPDPEAPPAAILVYVPGTDGDARGIVSDPRFLSTCKVCHAALLGCYFRGEGLNYDLPSGGSGQALDQAIAHFAEASSCSGLIKTPLLFFGHSQGAQFVFNYLCWHPERIKAFAVLRPGYFQLEPQEASFQIPGVIAAGENDESGRIRTAANGFCRAAGKHSSWGFLLEKNAGHEMAQSSDFGRRFFESICKDNGASSPVGMNAETVDSMSLSATLPDLCWLPNQSIVEEWKLLQKPASLKNLALSPDRPGMSELIEANLIPDHFESESGTSESGTLDLNATREGVQIDGIYISGPDFSVEESPTGKWPVQVKVVFAPKASIWGHVGASIVINGQIDGHRAEPLEISLVGMSEGPLTPLPAVVYLGVTQPGQTIRHTVLLKAVETKVHISDIKTPEGITATIEPKEGTANDLQLNIQWHSGRRLGRVVDEIRIELDSPQKGELRIPIVGMVSKPEA